MAEIIKLLADLIVQFNKGGPAEVSNDVLNFEPGYISVSESFDKEYTKRKRETDRRNSVQLFFHRKCRSCGYRWKEWATTAVYPRCPECFGTVNIININYWYSPKLVLHHISAGWVHFFAFDDKSFYSNRGRRFRDWFDAAWHCKMCFVSIILLRVTVYPILALGDYLQPFIPKGLTNATRNS